MENEMEKLKPCPFCGGELIKFEGIRSLYPVPYCKHCGATIDTSCGTGEAIFRWNTRAIPTPDKVEPLESVSSLCHRKGVGYAEAENGDTVLYKDGMITRIFRYEAKARAFLNSLPDKNKGELK